MALAEQAVQEEQPVDDALHCIPPRIGHKQDALLTQLQMPLDPLQFYTQLHQHQALLLETLDMARSLEVQMEDGRNDIYPGMCIYREPSLCKVESAHKHMYPRGGLFYHNSNSSHHST